MIAQDYPPGINEQVLDRLAQKFVVYVSGEMGPLPPELLKHCPQVPDDFIDHRGNLRYTEAESDEFIGRSKRFINHWRGELLRRKRYSMSPRNRDLPDKPIISPGRSSRVHLALAITDETGGINAED